MQAQVGRRAFELVLPMVGFCSWFSCDVPEGSSAPLSNSQLSSMLPADAQFGNSHNAATCSLHNTCLPFLSLPAPLFAVTELVTFDSSASDGVMPDARGQQPQAGRGGGQAQAPTASSSAFLRLGADKSPCMLQVRVCRSEGECRNGCQPWTMGCMHNVCPISMVVSLM
jgi:hypothetical protein